MSRIPTFDIPKGDTRNASVDYSSTASDFGTNATAAVWSIDEGNTVTVSGTPSLSSNVSTGTLVAKDNQTGCSLVKVKATFGSQTVTKWFRINVIDPGC